MHRAVIVFAHDENHVEELMGPYHEERFYHTRPTAVVIASPEWDYWDYGGRWEEVNPEDVNPSAFVTPDGLWHEDNNRDQSTGLGGESEEWAQKVEEAFLKYRSFQVFLLDVHS